MAEIGKRVTQWPSERQLNWRQLQNWAPDCKAIGLMTQNKSLNVAKMTPIIRGSFIGSHYSLKKISCWVYQVALNLHWLHWHRALPDLNYSSVMKGAALDPAGSPSGLLLNASVGVVDVVPIDVRLLPWSWFIQRSLSVAVLITGTKCSDMQISCVIIMSFLFHNYVILVSFCCHFCVMLS